MGRKEMRKISHVRPYKAKDYSGVPEEKKRKKLARRVNRRRKK